MMVNLKPQNMQEDKSSFQTSEFSKQSDIIEYFISSIIPTTKDDDEIYVTEYIELGFTGINSCSDQVYITLPEMTSMNK